MSEPITKERVLLELQEVQFVTQLCLSPRDPRFKVMMADRRFATDARDAISNKIERIQNGKIIFQTGGARHKTLTSWEQVLDEIDTALGYGAGIGTR